MKKDISYILCRLIACMCVGCINHNVHTQADFDVVRYTPRHASGFSILSDDTGNTLLRVTRPWQGDAPMEQTLAIFREASDAVGYNGQYIVGGAKRVICMSTSHIAMIDMLDRVDAVVGVSGKQYVINEAIVSNPMVRDVGYDSNIDYETVVLLRPDVVLMYGVSAENSAVTAKLRELKIPYIYLGDYTEQSPLGKAEWIVAVAEILGCIEQGVENFDAIVERYNALRSVISYGDSRPQVMFNTPYQDVWYMPSDDSYMVRLIEDAGGDYIYRGQNIGSGSVGISLEQAYMLVSEADIWLNVGQCTSLEELSHVASHFMQTNVVREGRVYNNNRRHTLSGGSDFWESAIVRPDVVLHDLATIIAGDDDELFYYMRLE